MINVATIDPLSLPFRSYRLKNELPSCSGVYLVLNANDEILYIGCSKNIRQRWKNHHKSGQIEQIGDVRVSWLELPLTLAGEIETALIERFSPPLNSLRTQILKRWENRSEDTEIGLTLTCKLPELMKARGISQKELAVATGLSPTTISKLYRNQLDRFDKNTLLSLCKFFDCKSISELIEIE